MKLENFKQFKELKSKRINESKNEIDFICEKYCIENYTINDDLSIDVDGNVYLYEKGLTKLPLKFRHVKGDFSCYKNKLTTLKGSPQKVEGDFSCYNNKLTTLEGSPQTVEGGFYCAANELTSLEGSPQKVEGNFYCFSNKLATLKGSPKTVEGGFHCGANELTTLEGGPQSVGENFNCSRNQLKDVKGFPERFYGESISIGKNPIEEIFKLFPEDKWVELPESLNEHDPIRGNLIILQRLEQCFYDLGLEVPKFEKIKFKNYEVREF